MRADRTREPRARESGSRPESPRSRPDARGLRPAIAALAFAALAALSAGPAGAQRFVPGEPGEMPKIKYADSLVSLNDRCLVKKNKLNLKVRPVYVNWRPIGFCSATCPSAFAKSPEKYLKEQKMDVRCVVNAGRNARPDATRRTYVNHEIYILSTKGALALFRKNTLKYCGWVTDPVSGVRFRPTAGSPRLVHNGRPYYFSTHSTRMQFEAMPDSFAVRKGA